MTFSSSAAETPLIVVALGGNALSPPAGDSSYSVERQTIRNTAGELARLVARGYRLLLVHGNGPQVGRLMSQDSGSENLDIHVAQTQGELGYLLVQGLAAAGVDNCVSLVTRAVVDGDSRDLLEPTKAVGPLLEAPPTGPGRRVAGGWRLLVGSPRPQQILELPVIQSLLADWHVIAGGGGGIPITADGSPVQGVIDKDWVAAQLAVALDARDLIFVTDVPGVFDRFGSDQARFIERLNLKAAQARLRSGTFGAGSMAPKVESAVSYTRRTGRPSRITALGTIEAALRDEAGTRIMP